MNNNENEYYIMSAMSGDPAFDNFSPSGFHLECDFEHIYSDLPTDKLLKMRENKMNSSFMSDDKNQKILNVIEKILIVRGALTVECDFDHNYTTKTTAEIFKDGLQNYMPNIEVRKPYKPNKIEIDGVWYDLVECPIQWEG